MLILPFEPSLANYSFATTIEGAEYRFDVRWNSRAARWYMSVFDLSDTGPVETPIIRGVAIVLGTYLGRTSTHKLFRQGVFVAVDTTHKERDATLDDLGTRVEVRYYPLADLVAEIVAGP